MVRFTLKQCAYFLAVADHGGIAQAARARHISQPAVAQAIDKLEALTGLRLFTRRHARGVDLTPQGRAFYAEARDLLVHSERVERAAAAIAAELSGEIRLACFHTIAPFCVAKLVKGYRSLYPDVRITASEGLQDELISGLESRAIDLAILYEQGLDAEVLAWRVLAQLKPRILLPADHALADRASIHLREMSREPFVLFDGPMSRDYFLAVLANLKDRPPVAFRSQSMESVRSAVGNGLGFSLTVMRPQAEATYDGRRVVTVPIADEIEPIRVVLAQRRGRASSRLLDNFADHCATFFADGF